MSDLVRRLAALGLALATLALVWLPGPASAHATLVGSSPSQGQHLDALPSEVSFEFNQDMSAPAYVIVTAPDGSAVVDGKPAVDGAVVRQAVTDGPDGTYTMAYRAVSEDGHPVTGEMTFTVGDAGGTTPTSPTGSSEAGPPQASSSPSASTTPTDDGEGSDHLVAILVGAGMFVAAGVLLLLSRRAGP